MWNGFLWWSCENSTGSNGDKNSRSAHARFCSSQIVRVYSFLDKTKDWHTPWTSKHKLNEINIMSLLNELKLVTTLNPDCAAKS